MQKPSKLTRQHLSEKKEKEPGSVRVNSAKLGKGFLLLSKSRPSEAMELGCDLGPSPTNLYMADTGRLKLKQARSPPRLALSLVTTRGFDLALHWEVDVDPSEEQRKVGSMESLSPVVSEGGVGKYR